MEKVYKIQKLYFLNKIFIGFRNQTDPFSGSSVSPWKINEKE